MTPYKNKEDYDAEPVEYCSRCYSLKIKYEPAIDSDCCMDCGSTEVAMTDIDTWERLYEGRYGHKYVQRSQDPRDTVYFKMSVGRLKARLYQSDILHKAIYTLYPNFPKGLCKEEAVILLFDKLCKDNRMDELRYMLYDQHMSDIKNYNKYNDLKDKDNGREEIKDREDAACQGRENGECGPAKADL